MENQSKGLGSWFHEYDHVYDDYGKKFTVNFNNGNTQIMKLISELTNSFIMEDSSGSRVILRKKQVNLELLM